jgi:polyisoprenoid-binding protein YceI
VTILALLLFGGLKQTQKNGPLVRVSPSSVTEGAKEPLAPSQLATWKIDYQNSHVKFTGQQAGAPFTGEWKAWNGELQFDEQNLNDSRFLVKVDINSVFSNDTERDDYIKSADFFDVLTFPEAIFSAQEFNLQINSNSSTLTDEKKFVATGTLQIKDTQHPVQLTFTTEVIDNNIRLEGKASLDRHKWNIGVGDWSDPTWVGSNVSIDVLVNASIK